MRTNQMSLKAFPPAVRPMMAVIQETDEVLDRMMQSFFTARKRGDEAYCKDVGYAVRLLRTHQDKRWRIAREKGGISHE